MPIEEAREADAFVLRKQRCGHGVEAVCQVMREGSGWRLQVVVSDTGVTWTASVGSQQEKDVTVRAWREALVGRGWT